jgi:hypothetical protein
MVKEYHIASPTFWDDINRDFGTGGGIYKLFSKRDGKIQPINRFLGQDENGTLYIGKATSYIDRVIGLKKTLDPKYKSSPHICGRRYNKNIRVQEAFPFTDLFVQLESSDDPVNREKELLLEYFNTFGEVPPLNAV